MDTAKFLRFIAGSGTSNKVTEKYPTTVYAYKL